MLSMQESQFKATQNMSFVLFDTETTGLINYNLLNKITEENIKKLPQLVQLSAIAYNPLHKKEIIFDKIIRVEVIPTEIAELHGITTEISHERGEDLYDVLVAFMDFIDNCHYLVAHNMRFDENIIIISMHRVKYALDAEIKMIKLKDRITRSMYDKIKERINKIVELERRLFEFVKFPKICTIQEHLSMTQYKGKFIKLVQLYKLYFGYEPNKMHNSLNDTMILFRCFYKMYFDKDICEENKCVRDHIYELIPAEVV